MTTPAETPRHWHELPNAPAPGTLVGSADAFADGTATMVNLSTADPERPFRLLVLRSGERVHAFVNRCAHFSIPLAAKQEHLLFKPHVSLTCNAHYVTYRWEDGVCESGECAGGALMPVPLVRTPQGMVRIA